MIRSKFSHLSKSSIFFIVLPKDTRSISLWHCFVIRITYYCFTISITFICTRNADGDPRVGNQITLPSKLVSFQCTVYSQKGASDRKMKTGSIKHSFHLKHKKIVCTFAKYHRMSFVDVLE